MQREAFFSSCVFFFFFLLSNQKEEEENKTNKKRNKKMGFWGGTFLFLLFGVGGGVGVTFLSRPSHQGCVFLFWEEGEREETKKERWRVFFCSITHRKKKKKTMPPQLSFAQKSK